MLYHVGRRHPDVCTEIGFSEQCLETALTLTSSVLAANSAHSHAISLLSGHAGPSRTVNAMESWLRVAY